MKEKGEQLRTLITGVLLFYLLIQIPFNYYIAGGKLSEVLTKTLVLTQILLPPLAVVLWAHHRKFFEDKFFPSKLNFLFFGGRPFGYYFYFTTQRIAAATVK